MGRSSAIVAPNAAICASDKSTKITPRSTTCTPRYAWMPAITRLAAKGHLRNSRTCESICMVASECCRLRHVAQGVDEHVDVVVEELQVVGDRLLAAHGWRHHEHLGAGLAGDRVRRLPIEIRLHQDDLGLLPLHFLNQIERVARRRGNARTGLHVADHVEPEAIDEVGIRAVIRYDLDALERRHGGGPALQSLIHPLAEVGKSL